MTEGVLVCVSLKNKVHGMESPGTRDATEERRF